MPFPGSHIPSEVGLQVLLSPLGANVVVRAGCCSVAVALPVYSTFKAIESEDSEEQHKCLVYWAAYGSFAVTELITDKLVYWVPFYYHMKFAFLVWLQLPTTNGAKQLYTDYLRPLFLRHQAKLDQTVGLLYGEMTKFVAMHQAEFQFAKKITTTVIEGVSETALQILREIIHPTTHGNAGGAIEGPTEPNDSNSDLED